MKNKQLYELLEGIRQAGSLKGIKFTYGLARNKKLVEKEIEILSEVSKPNEDFEELEKKRIELCKVHAEKDEKGEPKIEMIGNTPKSSYVIEDKKKFEKELEKMMKENAKVVEAQEEKNKQFMELLEENSEFKPYMIEFVDIPEDITSETISKLIDLIKEPQ